MNGRYTWERAICATDLPTTSKCILLVMATFLNRQGGGCFPSQETLADMASVSIPTVKRTIRKAKELGLIEVERQTVGGMKRGNLYNPLIPEDLPILDPSIDHSSDPSIDHSSDPSIDHSSDPSLTDYIEQTIVTEREGQSPAATVRAPFGNEFVQFCEQEVKANLGVYSRIPPTWEGGHTMDGYKNLFAIWEQKEWRPEWQKEVIAFMQKGKPPPRPESLDEVIDYFMEHDSNMDEAHRYWNHFESNGWKVSGRAPMKNWTAAANNWIDRRFQ